jgi:hypothetical protein
MLVGERGTEMTGWQALKERFPVLKSISEIDARILGGYVLGAVAFFYVLSPPRLCLQTVGCK